MRRIAAVAVGVTLLLSACGGPDTLDSQSVSTDRHQSAKNHQGAENVQLINETSKETARTLLRASFDPAGEANLQDADLDGLMDSMCNGVVKSRGNGWTIEKMVEELQKQAEDTRAAALQKLSLLAAISSTCPEHREWAGDYLLTGPQSQ